MACVEAVGYPLQNCSKLSLERIYRSSKNIKYIVQLILLNDHSKVYQLQQIRGQVTIYLSVLFLQHLYSTKLVGDRISKIRDLLPIVSNPIKLGEVAHDRQRHDILKYILLLAIPFRVLKMVMQIEMFAFCFSV